MQKLPRQVYRCIKQVEGNEPEVFFVGTLAELEAQYPLPNRGMPDSLLSFVSNDNASAVRHWFEKKIANNIWEDCEDPRFLSEPFRY